tara:strand:+ start:2931 stop:3464 length:534 start_codon:yes stop_codon:yes gene_type:complete
MTCIVGIVENKKVYLGADSCASNNYTWNSSGNHKLFKTGDFLIGGTSSFRMIDLLAYKLYVKKAKKIDTMTFMKTTFIDSIRELFSKNGYSEISKNQEVGGNFLIGFDKQIFEIQNDFSVLVIPEWGFSVGSGQDAARGSLYTTRNSNNPKKRLLKALAAAEAVVPSVRGPFNIMSI